MTIDQQIKNIRKAAQALEFGTPAHQAAMDQIRELVGMAASENQPLNVILLQSHGRRNYRTIPA